MTFSLSGADSAEQMDINRRVGRLGEKIAKNDYRKHGYHILHVKSGMYCDFVAIRFLDDWELDIIFVECKVGNAHLSKRQAAFRRRCKKAGQNFDLYHISREHLLYMIEIETGGGCIA